MSRGAGIHDSVPRGRRESGERGLYEANSSVMAVDIRGLQVWMGTTTKPMTNSITGSRGGGVMRANRASVGKGRAKGGSIGARSMGGGCIECVGSNLENGFYLWPRARGRGPHEVIVKRESKGLEGA